MASKQSPRAVEVDAVALLEIGLRLARDDGREVEDHVGAARYQTVSDPRLRQIGHDDLDPETHTRWPSRLNDVDKHHIPNLLTPDNPVPHQPLRELATKHPRRTNNQNPHSTDTRGARSPPHRIHQGATTLSPVPAAPIDDLPAPCGGPAQSLQPASRGQNARLDCDPLGLATLRTAVSVGRGDSCTLLSRSQGVVRTSLSASSVISQPVGERRRKR